MADTTRYLKPEPVIYQTLDRETVIINLMSGRYYSLNPTASEIWERLVHHASVSEIADALALLTAGDAAAIAKAVGDFVAQLAREGLVVADAQAAPNGKPTAAVLAPHEPFTPPELSIFTDMEHLMPLDPPIHQYSKGGWTEATRD